MQIHEILLEDLREYENNPRNNDGAVQAVADSIKQFGFKVPIVIDSDNIIVAGHTRLKAARLLGLETVPCIIAADLTPEQVKAFRLADNKTGELAEWDLPALEIELAELSEMSLDFDMSDFGFDLSENEEPQEIVEDDVPEVDEENEPICKLGDIWQLGKHRLLCGDCTDVSAVERLMNNELADMVLTDPPYNMGYMGAGNKDKSNYKHDKILNDKMSDDDFERFLTDVYSNLYIAMKDGASFYVFYKELGKGVFITALEQGGLTFKQELIWVKNQIVIGGSKYQNMYEPCLFGCKGERVESWYSDRRERSVIESIDLMNEFELRSAIIELLETVETDIIRENKTLKNDLHPTMKPLKLLGRFINNSSKKDDIVLDLFGGSGSTLITCEQLGRQCFTMELDPKYCDVIIKRWETFTGETAVKLAPQ